MLMKAKGITLAKSANADFELAQVVGTARSHESKIGEFADFEATAK